MSEFDDLNFDFDLAEEANESDTETIVVPNDAGEQVKVTQDSIAYVHAKKVAEKEAELKALEDKNAATLLRQKELKEAKAALQEQMNVITTALGDIDSELFDYRRAKRELLNEIAQAKRLLSQALFTEQSKKRLEENQRDFEDRINEYHYFDKILQHQIEGAVILANNMREILGDKRGAGKTLTAIASWDINKSKRILVIVPDDVVSNFVNEIHYWAPHRSVLQVGKQPKITRDFVINIAKDQESFVMVTNYSSWRKDKGLLDQLVDLRFDTVVLDEAHEIKNVSTSAYKGVRHILLTPNCCPRCGGEVENKATVDGWSNYDSCMSCDWNSQDRDQIYTLLDRCSAKMVVPMSGTVILNKPQDLFALLSLIDPINFREQIFFLRDYCEQDYYTGKWRFRSGGLKSLTMKLEGRYLARDGVATPGQTITVHEMELDQGLYPNQHRVIEQLSKHAQILLDSGKKMNILATIALITRKRQANVWPAGIQLKDDDGNVVFSVGEEVTESIKIDKCIQYNVADHEWQGMIPEFTEDGDMDLGARVVVFSQFKGPLKELQRRCELAGIKVARFDGDTPDKIRDEIKLDFDRKYCEAEGYNNGNGPKWQVILANYKSGGVGLNFNAATETIILDEEWNPGKADQAFGRTDRLGQTEHTNVHILRLARTIDAWMVALNNEKADLIAGFNESVEPINGRLLDAMKNGEIL